MCHEMSNINEAVDALETAANQLSTTQERINKPLFDLLFKLADMPQSFTPANMTKPLHPTSAMLKTMHTYAHRFIEFYMTECPDGVSLDGYTTDEIAWIANQLRARGDGLGRLLMYFGMNAENEQLIEYVDALAVGYDTFASMLSRYDCMCHACHDDEDECECCRCEDGCCGDCNACDDTDMDESQPVQTSNNTSTTSEAAHKEPPTDVEEMKRLFKAIFGVEPKLRPAQPATEKEPVKKPTVRIRMTKPAKDATVEATAKQYARFLGVNEADIDLQFIEPQETVKPQWKNRQYDEAMRVAQKRLAGFMDESMLRDIMPGLWSWM